jgi:hypothetical protein
MVEYTKQIQDLLVGLLETIEQEDIYIRQVQLREGKQLELYWHGFQHIFWDEGVQDFRVPTHAVLEEVSSREDVRFIYDYVINVFKAHGLSIIAALSSDIPNVAFSPVDASDPKDVLAAKKAELIGKVIVRKNQSKKLFYHALFTLFTGHFVAAYNYYERDEKHGSLEIPKFESKKVKAPNTYECPECDFSTEQASLACPTCGVHLDFKEGQLEETTEETGIEIIHKGMEKLGIFGVLNVRLPIYAADQDACGYLVHYTDQHFGLLRSLFPHIRDEITSDPNEDYEKLARTPSIGRYYSDTYASSLKTLKRVWMRPWMFETLDKDDAKLLKETFPKGVYFSVVGNKSFAEAREEELDAHWTIGKGDLSRSVSADPIGKALLPLQDLENTVSNLLVESLEHSVPSTFADPEILDFETYSKQEISPGSVYPIKNSLVPNTRLDDHFYTLKTASLPREGIDFSRAFDTKAQFVVGDFPSIFGGPQKQGSKTLGEYQESRNYALQRLSIPYYLLTMWWADVIHKSVIDHKVNMISDEKYSTSTQAGRFDNVNVLMEDLTGRFELLIAEGATDLPVSFTQKRMMVKDMVRLNSEYLNQFLFAPENRSTTLRFLGMEELGDLDANQANKQLAEISEMLSGTPVEVEATIDDSEIHLRVIKTFLSSDIGQEHKKSNPEGYGLILSHGEVHYKELVSRMSQIEETKENANSE